MSFVLHCAVIQIKDITKDTFKVLFKSSHPKLTWDAIHQHLISQDLYSQLPVNAQVGCLYSDFVDNRGYRNYVIEF